MVTCKQRADHFTAVLWFDFIRWRFYYSHCIKCNQFYTTRNCISSETHNWYMYTAWEIETKNLGFTQMISPWRSEGQNILTILAPTCYSWNNLWSVCNGAIQRLLGAGWEGPATSNRFHLKMYVRHQWSPIHIFKDLLPKYTFYTNLTTFSIGWLLIEDVTSLITFNLWKVEESEQHRFMAV